MLSPTEWLDMRMVMSTGMHTEVLIGHGVDHQNTQCSSDLVVSGAYSYHTAKQETSLPNREVAKQLLIL